jgi:hypothetical protein
VIPKNRDASLRAQDLVRGILIGVISLVAGYWILTPPQDGAAQARMSPGSITLIVIGIALQVVVITGDWLVRRYERAHGLEGQVAPQARHILQLLADGVSVLLFALAVFGGIVGAASSI